MPEAIQVRPRPPASAAGGRRFAASIDGLDHGPPELFFEVRALGQDGLAPDGAPFLLSLLFVGMRLGRSLVIEAPVCPTLLENLDLYQSTWATWRPNRYRPIEIVAPCHSEPPVAGDARSRISTLSGGLDSCYTLARWRRREQRPGSDRLEAAVFACGLDIPLAREREARIAIEQAGRIASSVGIPLFSVRTNVRSFGMVWDDAHGAVVAAVLHLFQGAFGGGLIPATLSIHHLDDALGTHPLADAWLSSRHFPIASDGHEASRVQKAPPLREWPEARRNLRVCYHGAGLPGNCGICGKCLLTKCILLAHRVPLEGLMQGAPSFELTASLRLRAPWQRQYAREILQQARTEGLGDEPWARGLQRALLLSSIVPSWMRRRPKLPDRGATQRGAQTRPRIQTQFAHDPEIASELARAWAHVSVPLRPDPSDLLVYRQQLEDMPQRRVMVLGPTPELVDLMIRMNATRIVGIDISAENIVAMKSLGEEDWTGVELVVGNWLDPIEALQGRVDYICCDGGTLFLGFPDQWSRLFEVAFGHLAPGGKLVAKCQDMTGDGRDFRDYYEERIATFEAARPALGRKAEIQRFRDLVSALQVGAWLGTAEPNAPMDSEVAAQRIGWARRDLRERFPEDRYLEYIDVLFGYFDPSRSCYDALRSGPQPSVVRPLVERAGFEVEMISLPPDHEPHKDVCYMISATKPQGGARA